VSLTLEAIAERIVWWKPAAEAIADRRHFLARVMATGTFDEVRFVAEIFPPDAFRDVLENPPAGVFDARSWAYWNVLFERDAGQLPGRRLPATPRVGRVAARHATAPGDDVKSEVRRMRRSISSSARAGRAGPCRSSR